MNYFGPAIKEMPPGTNFIVFSDEPDNAQEMFEAAGYKDFGYSKGLTYFDDFRFMKSCRHFIISNSSYSAMAAVLADQPSKKVIAPAPWFGGPYTNTLDPKDIYNPDWKVINYA